MKEGKFYKHVNSRDVAIRVDYLKEYDSYYFTKVTWFNVHYLEHFNIKAWPVTDIAEDEIMISKELVNDWIEYDAQLD